MKVIKPSFEIIGQLDPQAMLRNIEAAGRVCYRSEANVTEGSAERFIQRIVKSGHESVIEHEKITVKIICDRGVTHEIVRHRIASYSQESTRYCNYSQDRFGNELTFIDPCFWEKDSEAYALWEKQMQSAEDSYLALLKAGATPEQARSVLPNSLKTEIMVTMDLREWRHYLRLRTSKRAHPQIREISIPILRKFQELLPVVFEDIQPET